MAVEQVIFGVKEIRLTPYSGGGTTITLANPEEFTVDASYTVEELYGGNKIWAIAAGVKDAKGSITGSSATLSLDALKMLTGAQAITSVGSPAENTLNFATTDTPSYWSADVRVEMADGSTVWYHYYRLLVTGYKIGGKRGSFTLMDFNAMILGDAATGNVGYVKNQEFSGQVTP